MPVKSLGDWDDITMKRADDAPFWVETNGEYTVTVTYNPDKDSRQRYTIKIVTSLEHKVYSIDGYSLPTQDPVAIWTDICLKYGFVNPGLNFLHISGHPDDGLVTFTYRVPASVNNVRLPALTSRTFKIIDEDEWLSSEILSPEAWGRDEIWTPLCSIRTLPHYSQFHFTYSLGEIPRTSRTRPPGHITVTRIKFPIKWRLELFSEEVIQQDMHTGFSIQDAWGFLHQQVPRLYQHATFNYAGLVQPGLIVTAEVLREDVTVTIGFEVKDNGWIEFPNIADISNMTPRLEIYSQIAADDPRIPPFDEYIEEETRPYQNGVPICFYLKPHSVVTDRSDEGPGRLGGDNGSGVMLPAIKYGAKPINTADPKDPKVPGGLKSTPGTTTSLGDDDSEQVSEQTDSDDDIQDEPRRLQKIASALNNGEPVMVIIIGHFEGYQEIQAQCEFRLDHKGPPPPTMKDCFNFNWQRIHAASERFGSTSVPGSLLWTNQPFTDESLEISVYRFGMGLKVRYQLKAQKGLEMEKWPTVSTCDLGEGLSIAFPAVPRLPDAYLMKLMVNLTAPWEGHEYGTPWQVYLTQQPWRKSETDEIYLQSMPYYPDDLDPEAFNCRVPTSAAQPRDFSEITNQKEISRILKFGRDNGWNMLLSCASSLDGTNSATVTYETTLTDCEDSIPWYLARFNELMRTDGLIGLPAAARTGITWRRICRIEDFQVHIIITETGVNTPEQDGPLCMIFYAPKATLKFRCESSEVAMRAITMFYGQAPTEGETHHTKEWALIGSINGGIIDDKHRVVLFGKHSLDAVATWNKETFIAVLATQPYGSGLGKFTAKFKPDQPYSATIAIEKGTHDEHGTAIYFEQGPRRCLLTRRIYGLPDEDTFWYVMKDWAQFQPRLSKPRQVPGQLFYPPEYGHFFEKYWDVLNDPLQHPDCTDSAHSRDSMRAMSEALSEMDLEQWTPLPDTEVSEKSQRIARTAALSRRCPIMDAVDYWKSPQEQAQEESATLESGFITGRARGQDTDATSQGGMVGTESSPKSGQMDTCVTRSSPSYT
jgi:hypothetical protein